MANSILEHPSVVSMQDKIDALKEELCSFLGNMSYETLGFIDLKDLVALQDRLKTNVDELKAVKTSISKYYDVIRLHKVPEKMREQGTLSATIEGVGRIGLTRDSYVSIVTDMKEEAYQWLSDHGHGAIVKDYVHPGTLKSLLTEKVEKGEEVPESIFSVKLYKYSKITRIKK